MSKQIEKLTPGMRLYCIRRQQMGNTTLKDTVVHRATVISVAEDKKSFVASWNGNPAKTYYALLAGWKMKKPYLKEIPMLSMSRHRQASRVEIADAKKDGRVVEKPDYFEVKYERTN